MRALLVPMSFLAVAACAAPVETLGEPAIVEVDHKSDTTSRIRLGPLDVLHMRCEISSCSMELHVSGAVRRSADVDDEGGFLYGTYDGVAGAREQVSALLTPGYPIGVRYEGGVRASLIEAGEQTIRVSIPHGDSYGLLFGVYDRWEGTVSVTARVTLEPDRGLPLPLVGTGLPWTEEHGDMFYGVHQWPPPPERQSPTGWARDPWYVPVTDLFDFAFTPHVTITLQSDTGLASEEIYWFCDASSTPRESGPSTHVRGATTGDETVAEIQPSCPTWDESGRLYIEVDYADAYTLTVAVR